MSFIDASAMVAILLQEKSAERLTSAIEVDIAPFTNVLAVWETAAALHRKKIMSVGAAQILVADFLAAAGIEVVAIAPAELSLALSAFQYFGRHHYPDPADRNKGLNLADCFHYASAKSRNSPILTIDEGFAATDLPKGA